VARVMIVDDHPIVRDGLKTYLSLQADLDVVGEAADAAAALAQARAAAGPTWCCSTCASRRGAAWPSSQRCGRCGLHRGWSS
jgi:CheY-like chemotaxis protein